MALRPDVFNQLLVKKFEKHKAQSTKLMLRASAFPQNKAILRLSGSNTKRKISRRTFAPDNICLRDFHVFNNIINLFQFRLPLSHLPDKISGCNVVKYTR